MLSYNNLSDNQKLSIIQEKYIDENKSFQAIAKEFNTYANRILRDAKKFNIHIRTKSEAQKNALSNGTHKHPTKGKTRSVEEKTNIGIGVMKSWEKADQKTIQKKQKNAKKLWEQKTEQEKTEMLSRANAAVRETSKIGSKMEHYILNFLVQNGFKVEFHKEQILTNTRLQIDLFLPTINVAIEVDGPSHFSPVWGEEVLQRNIAYDKKKSGLIVGKGYRLIRIQQTKDFSKSRALLVCNKLKEILSNIGQQTSKIIEIKDSNA